MPMLSRTAIGLLSLCAFLVIVQFRVNPRQLEFLQGTTSSGTSQRHSAVNEENATSLKEIDEGNATSMTNIEEGNAKASIQLTPWELESARTRTCNPPAGVPKSCCLGSISGGGKVRFTPSTCRLPLDSYDSRIQELIPETTSNACEVCAIVEDLGKHNLTLSFVGDSMMRQTITGMECELHREFYRQFTKTEVIADRSDLKERIGANRIEWRYGLQDTITYSIQGGATIQYYGMYRPIEDMSEIIPIFEQSDVVVFDFGLHFHAYSNLEMRDWVTTITNLFNVASRFQNLTLLWRETSAQHYNFKGGHYHNTLKNKTCVDSSVFTDEGDPRLSLMVQAAEAQNISVAHSVEELQSTHAMSSPQLWVLPFREFTMKLNFLHNVGGDDCSHFCHTPYVWLPIWQNLRKALFRVWPK